MPVTVRQGSTGPDVVLLQRILQHAGVYDGGDQSGSFGRSTHAAVVTWQGLRGLATDGICGPKTWATFHQGVDCTRLPGGPYARVSANFTLSEFACNHCGQVVLRYLLELADGLQRIRAHFGRPVSITSGHRCKSYNATIPGAVANSQHVVGTAADIVVWGVPASEVQEFALKMPWGGIGRYDTFTHLDVRRSGRARWDYRSR